MAITTSAKFDIAQFDKAAFDNVLIFSPTEAYIDSNYKNIKLGEGDMNNSFKKGSTQDPLRATLEDANGTVKLETADSAKIYMKRKDGTVKIDGKDMTITDAVNGEVQYNWDAEDIDETGVFRVEIVAYYGTDYSIFPNYGGKTIIIDDRIE